MRPLAAFLLLAFAAAAARAQTPPSGTSPAPSPANPNPNPNDSRDATALQIELLNRQIALLSQLAAQNQRGLVVYPIALALPGPINCQSDCQVTVETICRTVRYPKGYAYPAITPAGIVGTYVNGVCYGP